LLLKEAWSHEAQQQLAEDRQPANDAQQLQHEERPISPIEV